MLHRSVEVAIGSFHPESATSSYIPMSAGEIRHISRLRAPRGFIYDAHGNQLTLPQEPPGSPREHSGKNIPPLPVNHREESAIAATTTLAAAAARVRIRQEDSSVPPFPASRIRLIRGPLREATGYATKEVVNTIWDSLNPKRS